MQSLYWHSRKHRKICLRNNFPHLCQILGGIHVGSNTCCATGKLSASYLCIGPRNPRTTLTKSTINIASANLGVVRICLSLRFRQFAHHHPPKIPPDEEGLLWGWCMAGGPLLCIVRNFPEPPTPVFSQSIAGTNGRRTTVQMGGVLRYKLEVYRPPGIRYIHLFLFSN